MLRPTFFGWVSWIFWDNAFHIDVISMASQMSVESFTCCGCLLLMRSLMIPRWSGLPEIVIWISNTSSQFRIGITHSRMAGSFVFLVQRTYSNNSSCDKLFKYVINPYHHSYLQPQGFALHSHPRHRGCQRDTPLLRRHTLIRWKGLGSDCG